jgi:hypothetical protein
MVPIVWAIERLSLPAWAQTSLKFSTPDMILAYFNFIVGGGDMLGLRI